MRYVIKKQKGLDIFFFNAAFFLKQSYKNLCKAIPKGKGFARIMFK